MCRHTDKGLAGLIGAATLALTAGAPLLGQTPISAPLVRSEPLIVVTAERFRSEVLGNIGAEVELDEGDIAGYGATSLEELLGAISPETGSIRGRGGGFPVVLLNGRRVSSFSEIANLPPEAIERIQIFPEELALSYGYRPNQRVVNFVLKANYAAVAAEIEHGVPTMGGFAQSEVGTTLTRIDTSQRFNFGMGYQTTSALTESERNIVQASEDDFGLVDIGDNRTLIGESDTFEANASYSRRPSERFLVTLSAQHSYTDSRSLLGLPRIVLRVPRTSPFARRASDGNLVRYLPMTGGSLERDSKTHRTEFGLTLNGQIADWRLSLTANYSRTHSETLTERADLSRLAARVAARDPGLDPFAADLGAGSAQRRDRTLSLTQAVNVNATVSRQLPLLPAGPATVVLAGGLEWRAIAGESYDGAVVSTIDLGRERGFVRTNINFPLTSRSNNFLGTVGDISVNATLGINELTDFGRLAEYGFGLHWQPFPGFEFLASVIGEDAAPSVAQLGSPVIVTPDMSTYDFARGQSVLVNWITGGNPMLRAEERRDVKLTVNYRFGTNPEIRLIGEYVRNRSNNRSSALPFLTPEIEAAFPDRVVRDDDGNLVSIDARPIDFTRARSERMRNGISLSGRFDRRESGGSAISIASMPRNGPDRGRWRLSVFHTYRIHDTVLVRPGLPELDLLDGAASGGLVPLARHGVELAGGMFWNGIGVRFSGEYSGNARVDGGGLPGAGTLHFNDIATLNLRAFFNFDARPSLVEDVPFLAGSRLALSIDNVFGGIRRVEDETGSVPLAYQPGRLDPRGRYIAISFRKRF